jgi:cytochrome c biogenesis protein CcmG, thiol:disulfide interchange protein DsbE
MSSRAFWLSLAGLCVVLLVGLGLRQAASRSGAPPRPEALTRADIQRRLAGAPPALAALHRQANAILPGSGRALNARLKALRGHPAVVNIWAAWCGPCRIELPVLQRVSLRLGRQVAFLGVDLKDDRGSARSLLRKVPVAYPSYEDPDARFFNAQRLQGVPSTLFYDRRGRQTFVHQGPYLQRAALERDIRRYALGQPA